MGRKKKLTIRCSNCGQEMPRHRMSTVAGPGSRTCDECTEPRPGVDESSTSVVDEARRRSEYRRGRDYRGGVG